MKISIIITVLLAFSSSYATYMKIDKVTLKSSNLYAASSCLAQRAQKIADISVERAAALCSNHTTTSAVDTSSTAGAAADITASAAPASKVLPEQCMFHVHELLDDVPSEPLFDCSSKNLEIEFSCFADQADAYGNPQLEATYVATADQNGVVTLNCVWGSPRIMHHRYGVCQCSARRLIGSTSIAALAISTACITAADISVPKTVTEVMAASIIPAPTVSASPVAALS